MTLSTTEPNNNIGLLKIRQADDETQVFEVTVLENGTIKNFAGLKPFFCLMAREITGQGVSEEPVTDYDGLKGTLKYTVSANAMQMVGRNEAYFSFRKESSSGRWVEQFSTKSFFYVVEKSIYTQPFKDSNYWFTFTELYRKFMEYQDEGKVSWEEFVDQNREILESIDPGGTVLRELIESRKPAEGGTAYPSLAARLNDEIGETRTYRPFEKSLADKIKGISQARSILLSDFGAVGDGITDDTAAFQAALDVSFETGRKVEMDQNSNYLITSTLLVKAYTVLEGNGSKITPKADLPFVIFKSTRTGFLVLRDIISDDAQEIHTFLNFEGDVEQALYVRGFKFQNVYLHGYNICMDVSYARQWEVLGCRFEGVRNGILIKNKCVEMNITDTLIYGKNEAGTYGVKLISDTANDWDYPEGLMISGCTIDNFDVAVDVFEAYVLHIVNSFVAAKVDATNAIRFNQNATTHNQFLLISNTVIAHKGIKFNKTVSPPTLFNAVIDGCEFNNLSNTGIELGPFAHDISISDCRFYGDSNLKPVMIVAANNNQNIKISDIFGDKNFSGGVIFNGGTHDGSSVANIDYRGDGNNVYAASPLLLKNIPFKSTGSVDLLQTIKSIDAGSKENGSTVVSLTGSLAAGQRANLRLNIPIQTANAGSNPAQMRLSVPNTVKIPTGIGWDSGYVTIYSPQYVSVNIPLKAVSDTVNGTFFLQVTSGSLVVGSHGFLALELI